MIAAPNTFSHCESQMFPGDPLPFTHTHAHKQALHANTYRHSCYLICNPHYCAFVVTLSHTSSPFLLFASTAHHISYQRSFSSSSSSSLCCFLCLCLLRLPCFLTISTILFVFFFYFFFSFFFSFSSLYFYLHFFFFIIFISFFFIRYQYSHMFATLTPSIPSSFLAIPIYAGMQLCVT